MLVVTALVVSAGFSLASLSVTHLNLTQRASNSERAENLARSAVHLGVARILEDAEHDYGVAGTDDQTIEVRLPGTRPGAVGRLTFSRLRSDDLGIPCSTNNLQGNTSVSGDGMVVPTAAVHLVGVGECAGVVRQVDAIVNLPAFPYALASAGPVRTHGAVVVSGLEGELAEGPLVTPPQLLPADLHSNALGTAISLASGSQLGGDVEAVGTVSRQPDVNVLGSVRDHADQLDLPSFDFSHYDPQAAGRVFTSLEPSYAENLTLTGSSRREGDLTIDQGGLDLEGAILYVDGDLTIAGGLRGKGIVCATGAVTLDGTAQVDPSSSLALLAGGDINLSGSGPHGSYLQGLVYTEGRFVADSVTLVGTLVAGGDGSADVDLTNTRIFSLPDLDVEFGLGGGGASSGGGSGPVTFQIPFTLGPSNSGSSRANLQGTVSLTGPGVYLFNFRLQAFQTAPVVVTQTVTVGSQAPYGAIREQLLPTVQGLYQTASGQAVTRATDLNEVLGEICEYALQASGDGPSGPGPGTGGDDPTVEIIRLDPSKFLKFEDRVRFALWRES
ncbi:MAG: hypothetical protein AB7S38_23040 [Vulcanimicrobiota bacterium]